MTDNYCQETDSKIIYILPRESAFPPAEPPNKTVSGRPETRFLSLREGSSLIRLAWDNIHQTGEEEVAKSARELLLIIQETISDFQGFGFDLGHLPPLQAFNVDDGSVLIEWIFSNFRIGFNIEPNPEDSGWYLVSSKNLGEVSASGYISNINISPLFLWLFNFALSNS